MAIARVDRGKFQQNPSWQRAEMSVYSMRGERASQYRKFVCPNELEA
ncbi:hypothetical protein COLSTE_00241 [Collinsella stercoris DSM 13279]|uniref:Uncharacterized protein n=1 Tax=Collinsella stercoris DSM 13279 TaxID=445975 RepID=B6G851_9ACTN|nr:hypothetical protein COLSTE_00241 [Collinsella stercoris DSM 13279]